ncbi:MULTISPECIES: MlaD family protein [unclassified Nocardia]|uniref:MlaD family protein n=1 Tax=unclassified Nocardia TaxID=2637762 RepID=UPI0035D6E9EC
MKPPLSLGIRLGVFATVMIVLLVGVFTVLQRPIDGDSVTYTAEFTDANGLRAGNDVRLYGVRVGKVGELSLDGANAKVTFTVSSDRVLYGNTKFAVRFQSLTGQRYLDIQPADAPTNRLDPRTTVGIAQTIPAFDITMLFNGLQPVLATLTPQDINTFSTGMLGVIEGDGTGLGPALDAIEKLARYTTDRQAVLSTLIRNLSQAADIIGGRSGNAMAIMARLTDIFVQLQERIGGVIDFAVNIPPVLTPVLSLLRTVGLTGDPNPELNRAVKTAFPDPKQAVDTLNQVPALLNSLTALIPPAGSPVDLNCSHGAAPVPQQLAVLIGGQRIVLCNS